MKLITAISPSIFGLNLVLKETQEEHLKIENVKSSNFACFKSLLLKPDQHTYALLQTTALELFYRISSVQVIFFPGGNFVMGETAPRIKFRKPVTRRQAVLITNGTTRVQRSIVLKPDQHTCTLLRLHLNRFTEFLQYRQSEDFERNLE